MADQTNAEVSDERLREIISGCKGVTPGPWVAREMARYGEVRGYFVQAPDVNGFAYGAELLAEDEYRDIDGRDPGLMRWKADAGHISRLDPDTVKALATELLTRRSVTSQASEGAGSHPVWTDAQIESMARELCSFRGETPHAVDRGGVEKWEDYKPLAKAALDEAARIYVAPVSKRVERLETALKPFADAAASLDIIADESAIIWGGDGRPENFIQVRHFRAARQALQGGRS